MDICKLIIDRLDKKGEVRTPDIVKATGFSRTYINRFLQQLREEGQIILLGKANRTRYVLATEQAVTKSRKSILKVHRILYNKDLYEDVVLDDIKRDAGIFLEIPKNISNILNYVFLEILNNAIEHSQSKKIEITMEKGRSSIRFDIIDMGVGIFDNIMQKRNLHSRMEAIQDLLKGKQSTAPEAHSGEGIFFTSKAAEVFTLQSSCKKLIFNNLLNDIFIKDIKPRVGTKATFSISLSSKKLLANIFKQYTDDSFEFSKTRVTVKLYKMGSEYISRSQARRILSGLNKFKTIMLDFKDVKVAGQGFVDEVFRVWKLRYPYIAISPKNANENIKFMINRALPKNKE